MSETQSDYERLVGLLLTVQDQDERMGIYNQLRHYAGLPPRGHRLTYDFLVAQRSVQRFNATWHTS